MGRKEKIQQLKQLGDSRKADRWNGYYQIGDYHQGVYDQGGWVSPYSKSGSNVDADVMIVLQDWASDDYLRASVDQCAVEFGRTPSRATNRNLDKLLGDVFGLSIEEVFATNLFPYVKPGGMSAKIPAVDLKKAASKYLLPQVEIVSPKIVVCLGIVTFNAVRQVVGRKNTNNLAEAICSPFSYKSSKVWCQAHTGPQGQNRRNAGLYRSRTEDDWRRMFQACQK